MESFGDMTRRISEERAKALEIENQINAQKLHEADILAESLYKREQRLSRAIRYICKILIARGTPHFNFIERPEQTKSVPITGLFSGKVKRHERKVIQSASPTVRAWATGRPYIQYHERGSYDTYYHLITEDGKSFGHIYGRINNNNVPQTSPVSPGYGSVLHFYGSKDELKAKILEKGEFSSEGYNHLEEAIVNFAIDHNIDLSEIE